MMGLLLGDHERKGQTVINVGQDGKNYGESYSEGDKEFTPEDMMGKELCEAIQTNQYRKVCEIIKYIVSSAGTEGY